MSIKSDDDFIIIEKDYDCRFFTDSYTEEINKVIKEINNVSKEVLNIVPSTSRVIISIFNCYNNI